MNAGNAGIVESTRAVREFMEKVLEFGPKTPEFTNHLSVAMVELRAAKEMITSHFGVGHHHSITVTIEEVCETDAKCKELVEQVEQQHGVSAGGVTGLRDILTFIVQNPQLLTLILSWFGINNNA